MPLSERVYCVAVAFKMTERVERRICIKLCVKFEDSSTETTGMIPKVFDDNAMSAAQVKVWHESFKDGQESVESDPCSGRPATSRSPENVDGVQAAIHKDQQPTVRELEADLGIPKTTVSELLTQNLGAKCVVAKFVLSLLLPEQKEHHAVANGLIQTTANEADFLKKVITGGELWVYSYDAEKKAHPVIPMEVAWFSHEERMAKSQQDQNHANCVFVIGYVMSTPLQAK